MRKKEWMTSSNVLMVTEYLLQLDISTLHTEREPEWKERLLLLTQAYQRVKKNQRHISMRAFSHSTPAHEQRLMTLMRCAQDLITILSPDAQQALFQRFPPCHSLTNPAFLPLLTRS